MQATSSLCSNSSRCSRLRCSSRQLPLPQRPQQAAGPVHADMQATPVTSVLSAAHVSPKSRPLTVGSVLPARPRTKASSVHSAELRSRQASLCTNATSAAGSPRILIILRSSALSAAIPSMRRIFRNKSCDNKQGSRLAALFLCSDLKFFFTVP